MQIEILDRLADEGLAADRHLALLLRDGLQARLDLLGALVSAGSGAAHGRGQLLDVSHFSIETTPAGAPPWLKKRFANSSVASRHAHRLARCADR